MAAKPNLSTKLMSTISTTQLLNALNWRYSVKQFDASKKIAPETWEAIEDSLVLSASSFGLQPYRFFTIVDAAVRAQGQAERAQGAAANTMAAWGAASAATIPLGATSP